MQIGRLARHVGVTAKTIRYYEGMRLLPAPPRTASRYRVYGSGDIRRVLLIKKLRRLNFSLKDIRQLLPTLLDGHLPTRRAELAALLKKKRDGAAREVAELSGLVRELDQYLKRLGLNQPSKRRNRMEKQDKAKESVGLQDCCEPFCPEACGPMGSEAAVVPLTLKTTTAKDKVVKLTKAGAIRLFDGEDDEISTREDLIERQPDGTVKVTGACSGTVWRVRQDEMAAVLDG